MSTCSIERCDCVVLARGWCDKHYQRWLAHGDPLTVLIRPRGTGTITDRGYLERRENGITKKEHVRIAERALGKPLPPGAVVHHVDGNRLNNDQSNLVICPAQAYHNLIHLRMRAFEACGHYDWRKCCICKEWDAAENLRIYPSLSRAHHAACAAAYKRAARIARKA